MIIAMLAWRNIWRNKMRSVVIMCSIALGLFAGIALLALYKGMMKGRIRTVIEEEVGHLQLHHPKFKDDYEAMYVIPQAAAITQSLQKIPQVKEVVTRTIVQGMLSTPTGSDGVQIMGIREADEMNFSMLKQKLHEQPGFTEGKNNQVLIGKKLAAKMKLKKGSKLVLTFTDTTNTMVAAAFRIAGIYQSTNAALDERMVYVQQHELNQLLGMPEACHEIAMKLQDDANLEQMKSLLAAQYPALKAESWKDISPETDLMVKTVDTYSYIIMAIIMLALAFGIVNTMLMAVMERTREIGMMVALGTSRRRMFMLIQMETFLLTLAGVPVGLAAGWMVTSHYARTGLDLSDMGKDMMSSFGFSTLIYPEFPADKLLIILAIVAGTAWLSSLLPAIKALGMKPVDALRH